MKKNRQTDFRSNSICIVRPRAPFLNIIPSLEVQGLIVWALSNPGRFPLHGWAVATR